ncbi:hypothetical protein NECAME_15813 [Necator americanus]|uniref:Uncharacterized protein n=1 Tax=Necator americanus TaxID=51031 RepID=W2SHW2_NECAM|nr:hypothetical protein NECAME_15813 [Necator americanus]ETN68461.1 hypothetical protein NECAME_15813 [Necator americanus]
MDRRRGRTRIRFACDRSGLQPLCCAVLCEAGTQQPVTDCCVGGVVEEEKRAHGEEACFADEIMLKQPVQ